MFTPHIFLIFFAAVPKLGLDTPDTVRCVDAKTGRAMGTGAWIDGNEVINLVAALESYQDRCSEKVVSLSENRDDQEREATTTAGAAGAAGGLIVGAGAVLARRKRKP
jgi:LPXTG-motif cell wall-anchored protein